MKSTNKFKENLYHLKFIEYLMLIYPKKAKSHIEVAKNYKEEYKNKIRFKKARDDLLKAGMIIETKEGLALNKEHKQIKPFFTNPKKAQAVLKSGNIINSKEAKKNKNFIENYVYPFYLKQIRQGLSTKESCKKARELYEIHLKNKKSNS